MFVGYMTAVLAGALFAIGWGVLFLKPASALAEWGWRAPCKGTQQSPAWSATLGDGGGNGG